jgi:hypothetical protein
LKAFCLASALLASIVPAHAGELSASTRGVRVGETQISRMYRVHWVRAYKRSGPQDSQSSTKGSASASAILASELKADKTFQETMRAAVAYARDLARQAKAEGINVKTRVRVRCMSKLVVARSGPRPVAFAPAAQGGPAASAERVVQTSTEVCSVKVVQRRARRAPGMQAFNIALPPVGQSGP